MAAALTLGFLAWRAGTRGVVGSVQDAATAVLAVVARRPRRTRSPTLALEVASAPAGRTSVPTSSSPSIAATLVVTVLCGVVFALLGRFRLGNLVRFVPYPVVGGFLAGTGWLLFKGGIFVASGVELHFRTVELLVSPVDARALGAGARLRRDRCSSPSGW